jgi:5-methylthioadenosine/S-adenosylhomocysteine deaminase
MVLTVLFGKIRYRDPTVMPAWEVLRMVTIEGAQAIGMGDEVGSLEPGKQADLILVDLTAPNLSPVIDTPVRNTVLVGQDQDRVQDSADEAAIRAEAQEQAEAVGRRVAADPVHKGMALMKAMEAGQL